MFRIQKPSVCISRGWWKIYKQTPTHYFFFFCFLSRLRLYIRWTSTISVIGVLAAEECSTKRPALLFYCCFLSVLSVFCWYQEYKAQWIVFFGIFTVSKESAKKGKTMTVAIMKFISKMSTMNLYMYFY